jgi:hypothetical protein
MLGGYCRGQPWGSPKKPGGSCLKPAKNKNKTHLLLKRTHRARPTLRWPPRPTGVAQSKAPSSRFRLARGLTPPSSGFRLARGPAPPSGGFRLARGLTSTSLEAPSQARLLPRVRAFIVLTQQSHTITRMGITPRRCSANSLGGTHPRHCRELCGMASVSPVAPCCPLPYG